MRPAPRKARRLTAVLAAVAVGAIACSEPRPRPRLVVLFSVCTLRTDVLSPYDPAVAFTPHLDRLGRAGVVFERHQTEAGQSGTAYASLFSGAQADAHGVYTHPSRLEDDLVLLAEAFARSGWDTWFWWGHPMAGPDLNYGQGVPPAQRIPFKDPSVARLTPEDPELEALLAELAERPDARAFVQLNFSYTHEPYDEGRQPAAFASFRRNHPDEAPFDHDELERRFARLQEDPLQLMWNFDETVERLGWSEQDVRRIDEAIVAAYRSGVHLLDLQLGQLVEAIERHGLEDEVLIAFTADHGQVFRRPSAAFQWTHGLQLAPEVLHVPLVVHAPGLVEPGRYANVTRSIDVYPTLAGLAGIEIPKGAQVAGVDLSPVLLGRAPAPELVAFSHSTTINPVLFERTRDWSLFHSLFPGPGAEHLWVGARKGDLFVKLRSRPDRSWGFEAYDLARDPELTRDVFDGRNAEHAELGEALVRYKERLVEAFEDRARIGRPGVAREKSLEKLLQLGYVDGAEGD